MRPPTGCSPRWLAALYVLKGDMSSHTILTFLITQAPRPSSGPHKLRESLPLIIFIRNRLKYALTYAESKWIVKERQVEVDGKARTDLTYPAGLMGENLGIQSVPKLTLPRRPVHPPDW